MEDKIDILNRQEFLDMLVEVTRTLADREEGCTFTIDGQWGCGKTYILNKLEDELSLYQDPDAAGDRYVVLRYNCWKYDFYDEPAIAIVSAIKDEIEKYSSILAKLPEPLSSSIRTSIQIAKKVGKELIGQYLETKFGANPVKLIEKYKEAESENEQQETQDNQYDTYFQFKRALDDTRRQLAKLAEDKAVILLVDELDRCLPEYAIKVLERLHHLFDKESKIIVILATDRKQLARTVEKIFGISEEPKDTRQSPVVDEYLKKFISFSIQLNKGTVTDSFWRRHEYILENYNIGEEANNPLFNKLPRILFKGIDVRSQEQIMSQIMTLHNLCFKTNPPACVLYFELIYQVLVLHEHIGSLTQIIGINKTHYIDLENKLGAERYKYFKEIESSVHSSGGYIPYVGNDGLERNCGILADNEIGKAFWFMSVLIHGQSNQFSGSYYYEKSDEVSDIIEGIQKYNRLSKFLTV